MIYRLLYIYKNKVLLPADIGYIMVAMVNEENMADNKVMNLK